MKKTKVILWGIIFLLLFGMGVALTANIIYNNESFKIYTNDIQNANSSLSSEISIKRDGSREITFSAEDGYALPDEITVTGADYTWNQETGILYLRNIISDVNISVNALKIYNITSNLTNVTANSNNSSEIIEGKQTSLNFNSDGGYNLPDEITVVGAEYEWDKNTGILMLSNPTSDVSLEIEGVIGELIINAPIAKTLTYNETNQELVTEASIHFGTILYALGSSTEVTSEYSTNIPVATDAGEYYVWYKVKNGNDYEKIYSEPIKVTINKAKACEPTIDEISFIYDGEIKEVTVSGVTSYMTLSNDSVLSATNKGEYRISYSLDSNHEWNDESDGIITWGITETKATITVEETTITKTYGETIVLPEATSNIGTIICDTDVSSLVNAGEYIITYTIEDTINYKGDTKTLKVIINKAEAIINIDNVATSYTYNTLEQTLNTGATLNHSEATLEYSNNKFTNAGEYNVTISAEETKNYNSKSINVVVTVNKATYDTSNLKWDYNDALTYDSTLKTVEVINIPEGVTIKEYTNNSKTDSGEYIAKATFNYDKDNYNEITIDDLSWTINKAEAIINVDDVITSYTYNTLEQALNTGATLNHSETTLEYSNNKFTNAGEYTVTISAEETKNYNSKSVNVVVTVNKATYDTSNLKWDYNDALTYDSTLKTVEVINIPEGVTIKEYTNNSKTDSGEYIAKATFNYDKDNYNEITIDDLSWTINKAEAIINIDNVITSYTYNTLEQTLNTGATLNHSETTLEYSNNKFTNAGEYNVTISAEETKNYNSKSVNVVVTVNKAALTVDEPILLSKTSSIITLDNNESISENSPMYGINTVDAIPSDWQTSTTFSGLTENTTYYLFVQYLECSNYLSGTSLSISITTYKNYTIENILTNLSESDDNKESIDENGEVTLCYSPDNKCSLTDNVQVEGATLVSWSKDNGTLTINNPTSNVSITINADVVVTSPTVKNLTYTGGIQELVNAGLATDGEIEYSLDDITYSASIPTGINANEYTVYYRVVNNANYINLSKEIITVVIAKADSELVAPTATNLLYTESELSLLKTTGSTDDGAVNYALTTDSDEPESSSYTNNLPVATYIGTYYVWYKVIGDSNHNDTTPAYLKIRITDGYNVSFPSGLTFVEQNGSGYNRDITFTFFNGSTETVKVYRNGNNNYYLYSETTHQQVYFPCTYSNVVSMNRSNSFIQYYNGDESTKVYTHDFGNGIYTLFDDITIVGGGVTQCIDENSMITMADGTLKALKDIEIGDEVLSIDFETMTLVSRKVIYTSKDEEEYSKWTVKSYYLHTFSDGTVIRRAMRHRFYNLENQGYKHMDYWAIGDHAYKIDGTNPYLVSTEIIQEELHYARITLEGSNNYFANGLSTGDSECLNGTVALTYELENTVNNN